MVIKTIYMVMYHTATRAPHKQLTSGIGLSEQVSFNLL